MSEANGLDPKVAYSVLGLAALGFIGAAAWFAREPPTASATQVVPSTSTRTVAPVRSEGYVGPSNVSPWPLTVAEGELSCIDNIMITLKASNGVIYAVNGPALVSRRYADIHDVWKPLGNISPIMEKGLALCNQ